MARDYWALCLWEWIKIAQWMLGGGVPLQSPATASSKARKPLTCQVADPTSPTLGGFQMWLWIIILSWTITIIYIPNKCNRVGDC